MLCDEAVLAELLTVLTVVGKAEMNLRDERRTLVYSAAGTSQLRRRKQDLPIALGMLIMMAVVYLCGMIPATERAVDTDYVARNTDLRKSYKVPWKKLPSQGLHQSNRRRSDLILQRSPERIEVANSTRVFVSVKTTTSLHERRLPVLMLTWMQTINASQVHIISDGEADSWTDSAEDLGFQVFQSNCTPDHSLQALCCKSGFEYEQYYRSQEETAEPYRWFCHFDDDAYVNVPALMRMLSTYYFQHDLYLGHYPRGYWNHKTVGETYEKNFPHNERKTFYYALGPAYCISDVLMKKLIPYFRGSERFIRSCELTGFPDDAAIGVVIENLLGFPQIEVPLMLNHLDLQKRVWPGILKELITIGYSNNSVVSIPAATFSYSEDPTRFLSYHCMLYPTTSWCQRFMSYNYNCLIHPLTCWF